MTVRDYDNFCRTLCVNRRTAALPLLRRYGLRAMAQFVVPTAKIFPLAPAGSKNTIEALPTRVFKAVAGSTNPVGARRLLAMEAYAVPSSDQLAGADARSDSFPAGAFCGVGGFAAQFVSQPSHS